MAAQQEVTDAPEPFRRALAALHAAPRRPEVVLEEAPAPQRLAPWAVALTADVVVADEEIATGRLVLLHDPAGQTAWEGTFRLVTFVRASVEPEIAADPLLPAVAWSWLVEALETCGAISTLLSGTVTTLATEGFGAMAWQAATAGVEMRASWTPQPPPQPVLEPSQSVLEPPSGLASPLGAPAPASAPSRGPDLRPHLAAWCALLASVAGLPPAGSVVAQGSPTGRAASR